LKTVEKGLISVGMVGVKKPENALKTGRFNH
jgi:hypothetical protein